MALSKQQENRLNSIIELAQKVMAIAEKAQPKNGTGKKRTRRSSADAAKMREQILSARAKGVPATRLAEKYGVSTAYIYMTK